VFEPGPTLFWGWVNWNNYQFLTSAFEGLNSFYCQQSRPWTPGAYPEEYLNREILPADEADLANMIGSNTNNAVSAIRYSFLGDYPQFLYGRQWTFYFFPDGLTVVALYGPQDGQTTYEGIWDFNYPGYIWKADVNVWNGEYFCFRDGDYISDCVTPPPPPEEIFRDGFE